MPTFIATTQNMTGPGKETNPGQKKGTTGGPDLQDRKRRQLEDQARETNRGPNIDTRSSFEPNCT